MNKLNPRLIGILIFAVIIIIAVAIKWSDKSTTGKKDEPGDVMVLKFLSSSAKRSWINMMVKEFNEKGHKVAGNRVMVKARFGNSGRQHDMIKAGTAKPDLWSPGDESWLELASSHWKMAKQKQLYDKYEPLVNIPLVIAMWEPMAKALGYPKAISWKDIAKIAADPKGWKAYGHPEWGKFRWGHAHPDANSGFLSVISEVYAVLGKKSGITTADLKKKEVVEFLKKIEGAVEHYGLSNSWIDRLMHAKGPAYLSCAVQYENTIIQTNKKHENRPFKLVAVYPREGNFWTQHPVAILNEQWVTQMKREAGKMFIKFLLSRDSQEKAMKLGLRPIRKDIDIEYPFDEKHGVMAKVDESNRFRVPDEKVLKRIRDLWEDVKLPATIIMVLDKSGSMAGLPIDNAKIGSVEFINRMKPRDRIKIVVFNHRISVLANHCRIRDCRETLVKKLRGIFAVGNTALYDAARRFYRELQVMKKRNPKRRYGLMLLSDGMDTRSRISKYDFIDSLPSGEDFDVPKIYTIAYGNKADRDLLTEISSRTNARMFFSTPEEIVKTYRELSANF